MLRSGSAVWGWLLLLVYTLADVVLLFGGGTGPEFGAALGLIPRYSADIVPVLVVGLGLVAGPRPSSRDRTCPHRPDRRWRRSLPVALALTGLAYLASSAVSTAVVAPHSFNEDDRAYVEGIRADLRADRRAVLYDGIAPDNVMITWFGDLARVSTVVGSAPGGPGVRPADLRDADGRRGRQAAGRSTWSAPSPTSRHATGTASIASPPSGSRACAWTNPVGDWQAAWRGSATTPPPPASSSSPRRVVTSRCPCARASTSPTSSSRGRSRQLDMRLEAPGRTLRPTPPCAWWTCSSGFPDAGYYRRESQTGRAGARAPGHRR